jgi:glucose-6-phosphate dehydrogenase assembly protein OpcA
MANAFNPQSMRPLLKQIEAVTVEYSSTILPQHSGLSQAFLFVSWLAERLQWAVAQGMHKTAPAAWTASLKQNGRIINVRLVPVAPREGSPGGIESLALEMCGAASLKISATKHPHCVALTRRSEHGVSEEMLTVMSEKTEAMLVAQELEVISRDRGYEAAVKNLLDLFP